MGPKLRGYAGRLWNKSTVAFKTDRQLPEKTYDWQLTHIDGIEYAFAEEKGNVVFLNFWATWCGPCLKEMPDIQRLYDDYGGKISFLLVTQEDTAKVKRFVEKRNYTLPIYFTKKGDIPEEMASKSLPTTYIIGKSGKIARAETGATNWNSLEIRSLLDDLLKK
jgi:thiol-disulfide isomerase/thioredoxin